MEKRHKTEYRRRIGMLNWMKVVNTTGFAVSASESFLAHNSGCRSDRQEVAEMLGSFWVP